MITQEKQQNIQVDNTAHTTATLKEHIMKRTIQKSQYQLQYQLHTKKTLVGQNTVHSCLHTFKLPHTAQTGHKYHIQCTARLTMCSAAYNTVILMTGYLSDFYPTSVQCASYDNPLGLQSREIPDNALTASSHYSRYPPSKARLHCGPDCAWYATPADPEPWLQVDLGKLSLVSAIATQGRRFTLFVKTYKILYSIDGKSWDAHKENGQVRVSWN